MQFRLSRIFYVIGLVACFLFGRSLAPQNDPNGPSGWRPSDPVCEWAIGPVECEPRTFFDELAKTTEKGDFGTATSLLIAIPIHQLVELAPERRCAIYGLQQQIEIPGTNDVFNEERDILLPGLEYSESLTYESLCRVFAEKHNKARVLREGFAEQETGTNRNKKQGRGQF